MPLSAPFKAAATAQQTTKVLLHFVEISHADIGTPLRFVNNKEDVTRLGDVYTGYNFDVQFPEDMPGKSPFCKLTIDNINRAMVTQIRTLSGLSQMTATVNEALHDTPDVTERGPYEFIVNDIDYDRYQVSGRLAFEDFMNDKFPKDRQTAQNQPGLFG